MIRSFYLIKPRLTKSDIFYKVYVTSTSFYFIKIGGQFHNRYAYERKILVLFEILFWYWFKKTEKKQAALEAEYDKKVNNNQMDALLQKKHNFSINSTEIKDIAINKEATFHTGYEDNGTILFTLTNGTTHKFIIPETVSRPSIKKSIKEAQPELPIQYDEENEEEEHNEYTPQPKESTLSERIRKLIFGDSLLSDLLDINAKLSLFGKILNIFWFILLIISLLTSYSSLYLARSLPIVILAFISIIILFRKEFGLQRYFRLTITAIMMMLSYEWIDLPSYLKHEYKVAEGIPSKFEFHSPRRGPDYWEVEVEDVNFYIEEDLKEEFSDRWFVIHYLPYSKFILDYEILTREETRKKLQMLND
jgi:hypothetical protein